MVIARQVARKFLNLKSPLMDITGILNSPRYPLVNGYPLHTGILNKQKWQREDLLPAGNKIFSVKDSGEKLLLHNRYHYR